MTSMQVVLLVACILGLQALVWIPLGVWFKRRSAQVLASLRDRVSASGERVTCGPEPARLTGSRGVAARTTRGAAVLTDKRLLFQGFSGDPVDLRLDEITGVREDAWFLGTRRGGSTHLIVRRKDGTEFSVMVADHPRWLAALQALPGVAHIA